MFRESDIREYAKGVIVLSKRLRKIAQHLSKKKRPLLIVVPSRGAVNPVLGALHALGVDIQTHTVADIQREIEINGIKAHVVLLPLTADTGKKSIIPEMLEKKHVSAYENTEAIIKHIRRGGMRILRAILLPPEEREKDPAFRVFTKLLELEGRRQLADFYRNLHLDNPGIVLIDTAISGSAVNHILMGAKKENLRVLPLILADDYGRKLREPEKKGIRRYISWATGKEVPLESFIIPVKKLITENRGAGLQGVWAAIYPQVVAELHLRGIPGLGGTWHVLPRLEAYKRLYNAYRETLLTAIDVERGVLSEDVFHKKLAGLRETYQEVKRDVIRHRVRSGKELVKDAGLPRSIFHKAYVKENNNRVVHIHFPLKMWRKKIRPYLFRG